MPKAKSPTVATATTSDAAPAITKPATGQPPRQPGESYRTYIERLAQQLGISWRGRVGQRVLATELLRADAMLYPGPHDFCETYGITFLEAQAAGCVPVTRDNGALPETNAHGITLPNESSEDEWVSAVQAALDYSDEERAKMRDWAKTQTWDSVADRVVAWAAATERANVSE